MKKAPFLAALPLIAACDDGKQIQELLNGSEVQGIASAVQASCTHIMQKGTTQLDNGEGVDFTAEFNNDVCQCSRSPDSCLITWGMTDSSALTSNDKNHADVSEEDSFEGHTGHTTGSTFMEVSINPDQECLVRTRDHAAHQESQEQDLKSKRVNAVEACRKFIDRVRNTIAAIRNRSIEFSKSKK